MSERSFSALVLLSILALAAPMLNPSPGPDADRVAAQAETLEAQAEAHLRDVTSYFADERYELAGAQLWATSGIDGGPDAVWTAPPFGPQSSALPSPSAGASQPS